MRRSNFDYLPQNKRIIYEQMARIYREQLPFRNVVWTPFQKKLVDSTIAFISVAGVYHKDDKPFTNEGKSENYEYRIINSRVKSNQLRYVNIDWEDSEAKEDINVICPIERLILLQKEGFVGKIYENVYSFAGFNENRELLEKNIKRMIRELKKGKVDGAIVIPVSATTGETACIISRLIEESKIPTATLTLFYEQALTFSLARCAFINFPFGRPLGKAHHISLHTAILRDILRMLEKMKLVGEIINLNYIWSWGEIPEW
ncbi:MAG: hypothetical protein H0Z29_11120 [Candidatus Marinimicrobia bacterium]|nr:hypothetical protein [Candidatus Neomarinimicrobiota bacterium]